MNHSQLVQKYFELLKKIKKMEKDIKYLDKTKEEKKNK